MVWQTEWSVCLPSFFIVNVVRCSIVKEEEEEKGKDSKYLVEIVEKIQISY